MVVRVGINGFGRIGRVIFRTCMENKDFEVAAINDPAVDIDYICYLIKFDSTHGKFQGDVSYSANQVIVDDKKIKVFCEKLPSDIQWQSAAVNYVVEASGMFTSLEKASGHLASGSVKRVIVTAPTVDIPMMILGVNKEQITAEQKVISCASSTLYCLAPIIKILEDNYGVAEGFITSIHAMTPSLKPLDGLCLRGKHWRDHRSIHQNVIPAATGACKALGKIIPQLKDKMTGLAFRVPIVNVSVLDISIRLNKNTTIQDIVQSIQKESKSNMKTIIKISKDQEVSSDFLGDQNSCIFDVNSSLQLNPKFFKLICWYENEYSYACRVVDSIRFSEETHYKIKVTNKLSFDRIIESEQSVQIKSIPYFNKEYLNYNCHPHGNKKILFSTSQDTGFKAKSSQHKMAFTKPLLLRNSESNQLAFHKSNKRNEISKIWKDEVKISNPSVNENRNSFIQSCISLRPSYTQCSNYVKTHQRLEEVKTEFSKMVNMTESLLKKSNQRNDEGNVDEIVELDNQPRNNSHKTKLKLSDVTNDAPIYDIAHTSVNKIYKDEFKSYKKNNSRMDRNESNDISKESGFRQLGQQIRTKCNAICVNNKNAIKNVNEIQKGNQDDIYKEIINSVVPNNESKIKKNLNMEMANCDVIKKLCRPVQCISDTTYKATTCYSHKGNLECSNIFTGKLPKENNQTTEIPTSNNNHKNISNVNVIKDTKDDSIKQNKSSAIDQTVSNIKSNYKDVVEKKSTTKREMRKRIIKGIIKKLSIETTTKERTRSPSIVNTETTISNEEDCRNLDIYDKLDSASATDSENSFQINERRSQVIEITDLTSSAEDLERLDKICRIIEISDDLSDRLFSVLHNNQSIKNNKWSFRDLCERLKLDEFCNNVFGHSTR